MREGFKLTILTASIIIVTYGLVGGVMQRVSATGEPYADLSVFSKVIDRIQQDYVEEPDMKKTLKGALQGMMEALDPFSSFVDHETYHALADREAPAEVGIALSKRYGYAYIVAVADGSPADRSGLRPGDIIESIDAAPTMMMSVWEAQQRLRGPEDTTVQLRVVRTRRSDPQQISLTRRLPDAMEPTAQLADGRLGYLRIRSMEKGVSETVRAKVKTLVSAGAEGILVDIRSCAWGNLDEAAFLADIFLDRGLKITEIRTQKGTSQVLASAIDPAVTGLPLVLLVDGGTSGPAEVFASALKDAGLADIVGERTNGHGSIQEEFNLKDGSRLFISTKRLIRPNGSALQSDELRESGIKPDLAAPERDFVSNFYFENATEDGDDDALGESFYSRLDEAISKEQYQVAVEYLKEKIAAETKKSEGKAA